MVSKVILGEPIVFGRNAQGQGFALRDLCPHRAVPLSCGRWHGAEIECAYHGWRFNQTGMCTAVPSLNPEPCDYPQFRVKSYPIQESQGNLWIYIPEPQSAAETPLKMPAPRVAGWEDRPFQAIVTMNFPCFIDHAVIGLMDPAHVPYVHRAWWWRDQPTLSEEVKAFAPIPHGFAMTRHVLERQTLLYQLLGRNPQVEITFQIPGIRVEEVKTDQHLLYNLTTLTPLSETETEVNTMFYTTWPGLQLLKPVLLHLIRTFLNQDREMIVKQQQGLRFAPPLMLIKDSDTQARWYYQLKREWERAQRENRDFVNPVPTQELRWYS